MLAGGYAERLWPLTEEYPKTLLAIAERPVLYYLMDNLSHIPEIDSFTICIDAPKDKYFENMEQQFNVYGTPRPQIAKHNANDDGLLVGPLAKIREIWNDRRKYSIKGEEFLVVGGDNLFGFQLAEFVTYFRKHRHNCNAIHRVRHPIDASYFGVPEISSSGKLTNIIEKPQSTKVQMVSTACYCFKHDAIDYLVEYLEARKNDNLGEFVGWLAHKTTFESYKFDEAWQDIGSRDGLLAANTMILSYPKLESTSPYYLEGRVTINNPVYLGKMVKVTDSCIGPYVYLGPNVSVIRSTVSNCIVYDNTEIHDCNLTNSIIGPNSVVEGKVNTTIAGPTSRMLVE